MGELPWNAILIGVEHVERTIIELMDVSEYHNCNVSTSLASYRLLRAVLYLSNPNI